MPDASTTGSAAGRSGAGAAGSWTTAAGSWTTEAGAVGPAVTGACVGTEPAADGAAATGGASLTVLRVNSFHG